MFFNQLQQLKIVEEEIDGEAYMGLTESTMVNQLKLKAGQVIKITKHIQSLQTQVSCFQYSFACLFYSRCMKTAVSMPCCFKCNKQLATVKDLCRHLRQVHLLYEPVVLSCAEEGCCRTFSRFNSFYRHVTVCHVHSPSDCNLPLASQALIEAEPPASLMAQCKIKCFQVISVQIFNIVCLRLITLHTK